MKTAIDTNVISDLLDGASNAPAIARVLGVLRFEGPLLISGVVYAELHARPKMTKTILDAFLASTNVVLDEVMTVEAWAEAGRANADYHARRRAGGATLVRPVLPDFLIGAQALTRADRLFTLNAADFGDFPTLNVVTL